MCIYCGTKRYIKIYESHVGPIPREENGRSFEIHHIDGNHENNSPDNLTCVSLQEHYDVHFAQGDYGACFLMAQKMRYPPNIIADLNKKQNQKRILEGSHNLLTRADGTSHATDKVNAGTHPWMSGNRTFTSRGNRGGGKKPNNKVHRWKNVITSETATLSVYDFIQRYNLHNYQGNISQMINGKAKTVKNWSVID